MAITKSLVDLMGGSIEVESKLGEGSTFIAKPVQIDNLKSVIGQVLDSRLEQAEGPEKVGNT